jgi:hypothetical protein
MTIQTDPLAPERPRRPAGLGPDAAALLRELREGEQALARRRDLRELHDRLAKLIAEDQRPDRDRGDARLQAVEAALLRLEGALHVDLERLAERAMAAVIERQQREMRRSIRTRAALAGTVFLVVVLLIVLS